jgi:hypothetical protein
MTASWPGTRSDCKTDEETWADKGVCAVVIKAIARTARVIGNLIICPPASAPLYDLRRTRCNQSLHGWHWRLLEWDVIRFVLSRPVLLAVGMQRHCLPVPAAGLGQWVGLAAVGALHARWGLKAIVRNVRSSASL